MTVLQANKFHYLKGGAERYYLDVSRGLRDRGHTVVHFAMRHPQNEPCPEERFFVGEVDYHRPMGAAQKLRAALRSIYSRETVRQVSRLTAETRPDVAHLHNIYHQISPAIIHALRRQGVPMVMTLHDYKLICPGYLFMADGRICECCRGGRYHRAVGHRCLLGSRAASLVGAVEAYAHAWLKTYAKVARLLCPSRFLLEKMAEYGIERERLVHLPNFLPLGEYRPSFETSDYFIYFGRLSQEKGVPTLLEALRLRTGGRLTCRIIGEGPLEERLRRQAADWGLQRVEFSGYLRGEALHAAVRGAAFTVVPSEWYENQPFAVLESYALGTPVIGARVGGIPELIQHERTGLIFPMGDSRSLAEAIERMELRADETVEMGRVARRWVEGAFAPGPHFERLEEIYLQVAGQGAREVR